jgi:AcrR family transcriptional regulator
MPSSAMSDRQGSPMITPPVAAERAPYKLDDIIDIAVGVFLERGFDSASMEHLAKAAGITKSSIYYHVSGKEELLRLGVNRALDALFAVLDEPESLQGPAADRFRHIVRRTVETVCTHTPEVALLVRLLGNSETERLALERRREFDRSVDRLVQQAIRDGGLRSEVDPTLLTRLCFGMAVSVVEWYRPHGKIDATQLTDAIETVLFLGALPR